ncbi:hypothetical protein Plhal304r1_c031g0102071 [Plasmopara halstedii]
MRVFIIVAIFVTGSSFCFAIKIEPNPCNESDTKERVPRGTSPHKAYAISSNAHRYNVALVEYEAHVNDKANEERMEESAIADVLLSLSRSRSHLPDHATGELDHAIDGLLPTKKARLEMDSSPKLALLEDRPQDSHDVLRNKLYNDIPAYNIDLEIIDEPLKTWLRSVRSDVDRNKNEDNPQVYDYKVVLDILVGKLSAQIQKPLSKTSNHQLDPHRQVVKLFDKLQADPDFQSFAEDVQRMMVLDSTYKSLVFEEWTQNLNLPEDKLEFFVGSHPSISFENQLFMAWLDYVNYYWTFAKDLSPDRYITFIRSLRKFKEKNAMDKMLTSQKFIDAFSPKVGDGVYIKAIQYAWASEKWMSIPSRTVHNSNKFQKVLEAQSFINMDELTWFLHYVVIHKNDFQSQDLKISQFLVSRVAFVKLVKLLISLKDDPELKQLVQDLLISMSSRSMYETLMEANVTTDDYLYCLLEISFELGWSKFPINVFGRFYDYYFMINKGTRRRKRLRHAEDFAK